MQVFFVMNGNQFVCLDNQTGYFTAHDSPAYGMAFSTREYAESACKNIRSARHEGYPKARVVSFSKDKE